MTKVLMVGDIHGELGNFSNLINKKKPDIVIQLGDFDIPLGDQYDVKNIFTNNQQTKVYVCPGNHERWDILTKLENSNSLVKSLNSPVPFAKENSIYYCPRTTVVTLPDGRNVLFMGGAFSIDKQWRTPGRDWFPEEIITWRDMDNLPDCQIDIVVSHTAPEEILMQVHNRGLFYIHGFGFGKLEDTSCQYLSYVLDKYKPKLWYFAHFHKFMKGQWKNTKWYALAMPRRTYWWKWLPEVK